MARLGLNINLATQALLAANKERAANNRSALPDRQQRKNTAAQAADTAASATPVTGPPTQKDEPRGGTPNLWHPDQPAAQRRKKKLRVFGLSNLNSFPEGGTYQISVQPWTAYAADWRISLSNSGIETLDFYDVISFQKANSFIRQDTTWTPIMNEELKNSRKFTVGQKYTIPNTLLSFDWTFASRSVRVLSDLTPDPTVASVPPLPFRLEDMSYISPTLTGGQSTVASYPWGGSCITRSDGKYIYHSRIVNEISPGALMLYGRYPQNSVYDSDNFEETSPYYASDRLYSYDHSRRWLDIGAGGASWQRTSWSIYTDTARAYYTYHGLYWRFEIATGITDFTSRQIGFDTSNSSDLGVKDAAVSWLNQMHPSDPVSRLWTAAKSGWGLNPRLIVNDFLSQSSSFLNRWPESLVYHQDKGLLTLVTTLAGQNTPRMYSKKVGNITYGFGNIPVIEPLPNHPGANA